MVIFLIKKLELLFCNNYFLIATINFRSGMESASLVVIIAKASFEQAVHL